MFTLSEICHSERSAAKPKRETALAMYWSTLGHVSVRGFMVAITPRCPCCGMHYLSRIDIVQTRIDGERSHETHTDDREIPRARSG